MADTSSSGQTTVLRSGQPQAFAGMVADSGIKDDVSSFNLETVDSIPFGSGVKWSGQRGSLLPTANNSPLQGIVVWNADHQTGTYGDLDTIGVKPNGALVVRRKGRIWVPVDAEYAVGDLTPGTSRGYCRFETDGATNTVRGRWRASDDGHVDSAINQVVFVSNVILAADGTTKIAEVEVDFTSLQT